VLSVAIAQITFPTGEGSFDFVGSDSRAAKKANAALEIRETLIVHADECGGYPVVKKLSQDISVLYCRECGTRLCYPSVVALVKDLIRNCERRGFAARFID